MSNTVLVVDDDKEILGLFELMLESVGLSVETASSGEQALEKAKEISFDLAILDVMLGDMKGYDLAPRISSGEKPRILFITGFSEAYNYVRSLPFGPVKILMKPVMLSDLVEVVNELLER